MNPNSIKRAACTGLMLLCAASFAAGPAVNKPGFNAANRENVEWTGWSPDDAVKIAWRTCNQFGFRNNTIRNGRRIGMLAKGRGGLIENNAFEGLGGGAVEFWNAPFEGLGAVDYVLRGNQIRNCCLIKREAAAIWATIFKSGGDKLHRNLLIADNEITGCPAPAILLCDTHDAYVTGNSITAISPDRKAKEAEPIKLINASAVQMRNNSFKESALTTQP